MLRRSLAVAGPSTASLSAPSIRTPTLAHAACALCLPSASHIVSEPSSSATRLFSTSALAARGRYDSGYIPRPGKGESHNGYVARFGARDDRGGNRGKGGHKDRFVKGKFGARKGAKAPIADFSVPEPPTAQEVGRRLVDKLIAMARDPELPAQLVAYGIKGRTAEALWQHYGEAATGKQRKSSRSGTSRTAHDDAATAIKLFRTWTEDAQDTIPDLAVQHDAGNPAQADTFAYLSDAVLSFSIEGEECLGRFCLCAFLDWADRGLAAR